ncbi:GTPase-activating protein LRG1 [Aspergillus brunneoviolaceus CBS 621.78]|uniref:Rho GTPase activator n=2 Tax=Aspergillus TaxID=5052 RepID=A0A8G1W0Z9_9EURO|nr:Rho GTPase activator [Aspergillus brunneoviolaceus CBS 621.78]XP_040803138.1 Rho GTPase activator [Aspergillus fijiensis CBS 313.89]RAH49690.1 Rho GTPase activator [Aspergillus brunneoviolaceus CBS 621.78]RAK79128.1 Rho GTPase activator [Aspergillus fijiensis CBS 313.89]
MPPGDVPLPDSLVPGNGAVRPKLNTSGYGGGSFQSQTPTSPADSNIAFDSPRTRTGGWNGSTNSPVDGAQNPDGRMSRRLESGHPGSRDPSTPRDRNGYWDRSAPRERSRPNGRPPTKSPGSSSRICKKCGEPLTGQFVRALLATYHLECFKCEDCGQIVASKFFPVDAEDGNGQYPLCETDYFRRLDLLCHECGGALRGSYITALERKYHIEHFTCSVCPTVFGAQDSYYEHEGKVYCHFHYSTQFAQRCHGCHTAILKQFVEIFRNGQNQHWHPECYMIHKFWNVRLAPTGQVLEPPEMDLDATDEERNRVRDEEDVMEEKVYRIWSILSSFEESSAACISDMLLHVSNGTYVDGVFVAKKFIGHVDVLFSAIDQLATNIKTQGMKDLDLAYGREAKLLCKKIVAFFALLSKTQEAGVRKLGVTQELLSLVTGLAHYLKLLIRIGLQGALKLEREKQTPEGLHHFLDHLGDLEALRPLDEEETTADLMVGVDVLADQLSDCCASCKEPIDDECVMLGDSRWHIKPPHFSCVSCQKDLTSTIQDSLYNRKEKRAYCNDCVTKNGLNQETQGGFIHVTKLQQFIFLLRVALARLLAVLRAGGTFSDDPNAGPQSGSDSGRIPPGGEMRRSGTRAKSYANAVKDSPEGSSLEQTVGEMRRLRSIRNERTLSTTYRKARASRIIDGPEGRSVRPGSSGGEASDPRGHGFQIVEEKDANGETVTELTFGNQDALTLDDIPRIVAAEQAKEQRPNAYKHAGTKLVGTTEPLPKYNYGHQRGVSGAGLEQHLIEQSGRTKKYFSELSALEYFIVRHVAVLSMEPLLDGNFTLEELLSLIESRKPTIWNIFGRAFNKEAKKGGKKKGVFGVSLDFLVEKEGTESSHGVGPGALRIPALVDDAVSAMRQMDMSVEGVFRKNGNIRRLKELTEMIDNRYEQVDLTKENPVQIAALLKKFLREMPDPLMTFKLHRLFVVSQKISDPEKQKRLLHLTCCLLPKAHRDTMEVLFAFLNWTSSFSHVDEESGSKMDIHNLATVITPNILYPNTKASTVDESFLAIEAVNSLITYNDTMCEIPEDLQSVLNDPTFFKENSEVTTKDILKRYGDIARGSMSQKPLNGGETVTITNSTRGANIPTSARIETDASQDAAWQAQSSVRHVQSPGGLGHSTSTGQTGMDLGPASAKDYRERSTSNSSQQNTVQPDGQGHPMPYRPRPGAGPMGVAG